MKKYVALKFLFALVFSLLFALLYACSIEGKVYADGSPYGPHNLTDTAGSFDIFTIIGLISYALGTVILFYKELLKSKI